MHINKILENSIRKNWEELALTDFNGISLQYRDIARKIAKLHLLFENAGIQKGDKIALCGKNSTQWSVAFLASLTYGAVPVPILHEFKPDNIHHIVNHSDARLLFIDTTIWENLNAETMPEVDAFFNIFDFSLLLSRKESITHARQNLNAIFGMKYPERFTREDVVYCEPDPESLAVINYTSGSTGFSKGVMIPYRAITSNIEFALSKLSFLGPGDGIICMLPLAHMYGLVVEMIHPLTKGCHVYFLTRVPSPKVIIDAFATVKPRLIIAVPLIIEKIIKTKIFPLLEKPHMRLLMTMPFVNDHLLGKIKAKLTETFGGQLYEMIIGGAALNKDVERFLRKIEFPYTVGYGMTECAPLISYAGHEVNRTGSCGQIVDRMQMKVNSPDPKNIAGELIVTGENVMLGYYKNEEATQEALRDGWLYTGDLCNVDEDGFIYIRGRNKNMILGPSGQNIYPEEIEQKLNNMPYVCESLVVEQSGKLIALIYPDLENAQAQHISDSEIPKIMNDNIAALNKELPAYSQIAGLKLYSEEFEKTPKRSIKRYLYQHQ